MGAVGLQTHIWANNTRSVILLVTFPILLIGIVYGVQLIMMGLGFLPNSGKGLGDDMALAASWLGATIPLALGIAAAWFAIAYFGSQAMVDALTGARKVERRTEPELYNLLENLAISRGLRTPTLRVIDNDSLNAFATGLHEGQYSITVTRGLVEQLSRDELEAVLAHELTHVINKDVRTMVIASIFAGIISVIAELVFRTLLYSGGRRRSSDENKNAMPLILIGIAFAVIGFVLAIVIRMMLSRTREYVADAGAVELTKNPDAMISALRKVEGRSSLKGPDELQQLFLDNQPDGVGLEGLFASHPPIQKRIDALVKFGGGRDPGLWDGEAQASASSGYGTSVPVTG